VGQAQLDEVALVNAGYQARGGLGERSEQLGAEVRELGDREVPGGVTLGGDC
jgi:hypothetical protein